MTPETWLSMGEVLEATGWSRRTVFSKQQKGELKTRPSHRAANGKDAVEYASGSLPSSTQLTLMRQRMKSSALVLTSGAQSISSVLPVSPPKQGVLDLGPSQYEQALLRFELLAPLRDHANCAGGKPLFRDGDGRALSTRTEIVEHIAQGSGKSTKTVWDWWTRFTKGGFGALADRRRSDRNQSRYFGSRPKVAAFVENKYLNEGLTIQLVQDALVRMWPELRGSAADEPPDYKTLRVFLNSQSELVKAVGREGRRKYDEDFAPFMIRNIRAQNVNAYWISDHVLHDVWVRNDAVDGIRVFGEIEENEALRPWLTCIVDMRSRRVVGVAWCNTPSSQSIGSALRVALQIYGKPETFYIDNGKDYRKLGKVPPALSPEAAGVLFKLGIKSQHCLPRHPQSKQIESFFKTLHQRFDVLWRPFYCGTSPVSRPESCDEALREHKRALKEGRPSPLPAASDFIKAACLWLDEFNSEFKHSGQGMNRRTAAQVYDLELPPEKRQPVDVRSLEPLFWDRRVCTVREGGTVLLNKARYEPADSESFAALMLDIKREIHVACDPMNVGEAVAVSSDGTMCHLRAQELLVHGATPQSVIKASMRARRGAYKIVKQGLAALERSQQLEGNVTEIESLLKRAGVSGVRPNIHTMPVLQAVNQSSPRLHADDIVRDVIAEMD